MKHSIKINHVHEGFNPNPTGRGRKLTILSGGTDNSDKESEYMKSRADVRYSQDRFLLKRLTGIRPQHSSFTIATTGTIIQGKQTKRKCRCCRIIPSPSKHFCTELHYNILKAKFRYNTRKLKSYWYSIYKKYEQLEQELMFPVYNEKSEGLTHIAAKIWVSTLALQYLVRDEELQIEKPNDLQEIKKLEMKYSELIYKCGIIGTDSMSLINKLSDMMQKCQDLLGKMKNKYFTEIQDRQSQWDSDDALSYCENHDLKDCTKRKLLQGSTLADRGLLDRILIYNRTINDHRWTQLGYMPKPKRLTIITDCLESTINSVNLIHEKLISPILHQISKGTKSTSCLHQTFYPRLVKMSIILNKMTSKNANEFLVNDSHTMHKEFKTIEILIGYIQTKGNQLGFQLLEIIGMSRLCFALMEKLLKFKIMPYEEIIRGKSISTATSKKQKKAKKEKHEIKVDITKTMFNDFKGDEFWKTKYPDILRKVPVILNDMEICLHKKLNQEELDILKEQERIRTKRAEEAALLLQLQKTSGSGSGTGGDDPLAGSSTMMKNPGIINPTEIYEPEHYKPSKHIRPLPKYSGNKSKKEKQKE